MIGFLDCFDDKEEWNHRISQGTPDPHFSAEYYQIWGGGKLAYDQWVLHPFRHQSENWIGNAYNFGTYESYSNEALGFEVEFRTWKDKNKLNERGTLHICPPVNNWRAKPTVKLPLFNQKSLLFCFNGMRQTTKHAIRKAVERGSVTSRANLDDSFKFEKMYNDAMRVKRAAPHWFYPDGFFYKLLNVLGPQRSALFFTRINGEIESGCVVIYSRQCAYYHWAARRGNYSVDHAQVWSIICWAQSQGIDGVYLGGGLTAADDDPLWIFKRGFQWDSNYQGKSFSFETRYKEE